MFHVKHPPENFLKEQADFLNSGGVIGGCVPGFLTPFLLSINKPTCIYVDDNLFNLIHEKNQLDWDSHKVLWVPPKSSFINEVPIGFNSLYSKSIGLLKSISSSLWPYLS